MKVRTITEADIPVLVDMGAKAHEESKYKGLSFSVDKCTELCHRLIGDSNLLCVVAVKEDMIVGILAASANPTYFSCDRTASDILIYVLPKHRGSWAFFVLCSEYLRWAKESGAKIIFLSNTTGYEPEKVGKLYQKLGFEQVGGIYRQEVHNV
jgi:GNAT superfamily N-acetyltransferase